MSSSFSPTAPTPLANPAVPGGPLPSLRPARSAAETARTRRAGKADDRAGGVWEGGRGGRRRLRAAAALLLAAFLGFLTRHLFLEDFGLNELTAAGWQRWAVVGALAGVVLWLSLPLPAGPRALQVCEAVTFGVPALFFTWIHQHGLAAADPAVRPLLAAAFPATAAAPWMLLIQIYALFVPNGAGRAAAAVGLMAAVPLTAAGVAAARFPEVRAVLFGQGLYSAMAVWIGVSAGAALYGAVKLSALRKAAREAREVGSYRLLERIGSGGMGEVYLAEHRLLRRPCAVKLIRPGLAEDDRALARFDGEVRAAARLTHPNTIEIYDFGVSESGLFYCAMEYLPGLTLHELVQRAGPLPPGRVTHLLAPVCGALAEAHGVGLIHRDVKPANVIAADRGGVRDVPKLLDFGLVKQIGKQIGRADPPPDDPHADGAGPDDPHAPAALTQAGTVVGSPLFAAPEVARGGAPTAASDLYGVGATAYFLLTGRPVFDEVIASRALLAHAHAPPVPVREANPAVPADLSAVVMRCLAKDPAERFAGAAELADALRACACAADWTPAHARDWWAALEGAPSGRHPLALDAAGVEIVPDGSGFSTRERGPDDTGSAEETLGDFVLRDGGLLGRGPGEDPALTAALPRGG